MACALPSNNTSKYGNSAKVMTIKMVNKIDENPTSLELEASKLANMVF